MVSYACYNIFIIYLLPLYFLFMVLIYSVFNRVVHARARILVVIMHYFSLQWLLFRCIIVVHF